MREGKRAGLVAACVAALAAAGATPAAAAGTGDLMTCTYDLTVHQAALSDLGAGDATGSGTANCRYVDDQGTASSDGDWSLSFTSRYGGAFLAGDVCGTSAYAATVELTPLDGQPVEASFGSSYLGGPQGTFAGLIRNHDAAGTLELADAGGSSEGAYLRDGDCDATFDGRIILAGDWH